MRLSSETVLITGANRGFGHHVAAEAVRRGAKVYATARRPETVNVPGAEVLRLDITDQASVDTVVALATDVGVLINNAASSAGGNLLTADMDSIRDVMDSNYYGTLRMIRAFAPTLRRNGGGTILNVLSSAAWMTVDGNTAYAAAKSAEWGLTNGVRLELAPQNTLVSALVPGLIATQTLLDFVNKTGYEIPEGDLNEPEDLARYTFDQLEAGSIEILDQQSARVKAGLSRS